MSTKTEDVEAAKARFDAYADGTQTMEFDANGYMTAQDIDALRTLLASHAALTAFVANVAEPHHSSDHYSLATAFERFQTRARALLSGKASA